MWGLDPHPYHCLLDPQGRLGATPSHIWIILALRLLSCHSATIGGTSMFSCRLTFMYVPRMVWFGACLVYPIGLYSSRAADSWRLVYVSARLFTCLLTFYICTILL